MRKHAVFMAVLALGVPLPATAREPVAKVTDDSVGTLRQFLARSTIVVVGEVASAPEKMVACEGERPSITTFGFDVKVHNVLKGAEKREKVRVEVTRFDEPWSAAPKVGEKHVFFLRPLYPDLELHDRTNPLVSVEKWSGMQPASSSLIAGLERAAAVPEVKPMPEPPAEAHHGLRLRYKGISAEDGQALIEVLNQTDKPISYSGYTADSFDPPLPRGTVFPMSQLELQQDGKWTEHPIGYCGFGLGPVTFEPRQPVTFAIPLPEGNWEALRVGVRCQKGEIAEATWETVWSRKLFRSILK